jgi:Helix-turn-helix domain
MSRIDDDVRAARELLRRLIEASGETCLQLDQKLGWGRGTLGRLLRGEHRLTLKYILLVLDALGLDPDFYFYTLFQGRRRARSYQPVSYEQLKQVLERHGLTLTRKTFNGPLPPADPEERERRFAEAARLVMLQHAGEWERPEDQ